MPLDLHVQIKERFQNNLDQRFDPTLAEKHRAYYSISIGCQLCSEYLEESDDANGNLNCKRCPFQRFSRLGISGCSLWIKCVIPTVRRVFYLGTSVFWYDNEVAPKQMAQLRAAAIKHIEWISNKS